MPPLRIKHLVSFSSQDPQFPADNLLTPTCCRPWLSAPSDRSDHLRVILQLEKASVIGFLDFGNCGAAFLEVVVGRSSWDHDQPLVTLLPMTTLSTPLESRSYGGGTGVYMFGPDCFIQTARTERWDRLMLVLSQPFHKGFQFGASFIYLFTPGQKQERRTKAVAKFSLMPPILFETQTQVEKDELQLRLPGCTMRHSFDRPMAVEKRKVRLAKLAKRTAKEPGEIEETAQKAKKIEESPPRTQEIWETIPRAKKIDKSALKTQEARKPSIATSSAIYSSSSFLMSHDQIGSLTKLCTLQRSTLASEGDKKCLGRNLSRMSSSRAKKPKTNIMGTLRCGFNKCGDLSQSNTKQRTSGPNPKNSSEIVEKTSRNTPGCPSQATCPICCGVLPLNMLFAHFALCGESTPVPGFRYGVSCQKFFVQKQWR
uniref:protein XNDC1N n=1 Tax=Myxine glutinosa TaxID=7769 RepID=UPI00358FBAD6